MLLAERIGDDVLIDAWCEMEAVFLVLNCGCSRQLPAQSFS
jgi:hypothetical protein